MGREWEPVWSNDEHLHTDRSAGSLYAQWFDALGINFLWNFDHKNWKFSLVIICSYNPCQQAGFSVLVTCLDFGQAFSLFHEIPPVRLVSDIKNAYQSPLRSAIAHQTLRSSEFQIPHIFFPVKCTWLVKPLVIQGLNHWLFIFNGQLSWVDQAWMLGGPSGCRGDWCVESQVTSVPFGFQICWSHILTMFFNIQQLLHRRYIMI